MLPISSPNCVTSSASWLEHAEFLKASCYLCLAILNIQAEEMRMTEERNCPNCGKPLPPDAARGLCPDCLIKVGLGTGVEIGPDTEAGTGNRSSGFVPPAAEELARYFPQLEILELLGHGGMGAVYKARQTQLNRIVALKILPTETAADPAFAGRFQREAQALAQLNHPHVVTVHHFGDALADSGSTGTANGLYYFLMEFVDGSNLRRLLESGHLAPHEALAIVPQI